MSARTVVASVGTVFLHHSFNGAAPIERGFMLCNGDIINQANYDAIHGAGMYVKDQVASSPIVGKYLPNMVDKFPVGSAATTQAGTIAITSEGLTGHTLSVGAHNHQWYLKQPNTTASQTYNSSGVAINIASAGKNAGVIGGVVVTNGSAAAPGNSEISTDAHTTNAGAISQSIKPESIQMLYKIKVI